MTEPTPLTAEQLLPLAITFERRQRQQQRGQRILRYPLPPCPTCGAMPDEVTTGRPPNHFAVAIVFERCGHHFTVDDDTAFDVTEQAARIVNGLEAHPMTEPREAIVATGGPYEVAGQKPEYVIALYADDGELTVGVRPDGSIAPGPNYQPDDAAREFWNAVTRAAQAANPWKGAP